MKDLTEDQRPMPSKLTLAPSAALAPTEARGVVAGTALPVAPPAALGVVPYVARL